MGGEVKIWQKWLLGAWAGWVGDGKGVKGAVGSGKGKAAIFKGFGLGIKIIASPFLVVMAVSICLPRIRTNNSLLLPSIGIHMYLVPTQYSEPLIRGTVQAAPIVNLQSNTSTEA